MSWGLIDLSSFDRMSRKQTSPFKVIKDTLRGKQLGSRPLANKGDPLRIKSDSPIDGDITVVRNRGTRTAPTSPTQLRPDRRDCRVKLQRDNSPTRPPSFRDQQNEVIFPGQKATQGEAFLRSNSFFYA